VLPPGSEVVDVHEHGTASWSSGYKVDVEVDGEEKEYFLKVRDSENSCSFLSFSGNAMLTFPC